GHPTDHAGRAAPDESDCPGRGRAPSGDPGGRRRAGARAHRRRGRSRLRARDRRGHRLRVRRRGDGVDARLRARLRRGGEPGHPRTDPGGRPSLPRPGAVHGGDARLGGGGERVTAGAGREPEERRGGVPVGDGAAPRFEVPREVARAPARDAEETVLVRTLEGGTMVIVRENRAAPVVALALLVEGGSVAETATTSGVTTLLG